jgi:hypothetical protein
VPRAKPDGTTRPRRNPLLWGFNGPGRALRSGAVVGGGRSGTADGDERDPFDAVFDDDFISGARFEEPTAHERRKGRDDELRQARRAARRRRWSQHWSRRWSRFDGWGALLLVGAIVVAAVVVPPLLRDDDDGAEFTAPEPDRVEILYVHPEDVVPDAERLDALGHEATVAIEWIGHEVGAPMRVESASGLPAVRTVPLAVPVEDLVGDIELAALVLIAPLVEELRDDTIYLVFADVRTHRTAAGGAECGSGGFGIAVVWLGNCPDRAPSATSAWGEGLTVVGAHQLVHALGAGPCDRGAAAVDHVDDDPADLLYDVPGGQETGPAVHPDAIVLDAGHDDYVGHGRDDCVDLADSAVFGA